MASSSSDPTTDTDAYRAGWQAISAAVDAGSSWSGHERNNAYLNLGDGTFVEVASVLGLDHDDDGRGVLRVDWDGDGDLDLVQRARTAPGLRILENTLGRGGWTVELRARGANTDAVGARLTWRVGERTVHQEVRAGEGYLTQPSLRRTLGSSGSTSPVEVDVRWPDGSQETFRLDQPGVSTLAQGTGAATPQVPGRNLSTLAPGPLPEADDPNRLVLRTPLPLAPGLLEQLVGDLDGRPVLVEAWSRTCAPCRAELASLVEARVALAEVGLAVHARCVDPVEDARPGDGPLREALGLTPEDRMFQVHGPQHGVQDVLESLIGNILETRDGLRLPTSFLLDSQGAVQAVYLGEVRPDVVIEDVRSWVHQRPQAAFRSHRPGRWFFGAPRNWDALARVLQELGDSASAGFYSDL